MWLRWCILTCYSNYNYWNMQMQQQNKQMKKETVKIAKYLDLMMPMYNLIVCDNNHSKAFKLKKQEDLLPMVFWNSCTFKILTKVLGNYWDASNCKINLMLNWSAYFIIFDVAGATTFTRTDNKLYVPLVILLIWDYSKFNWHVNWSN